MTETQVKALNNVTTNFYKLIPYTYYLSSPIGIGCIALSTIASFVLLTYVS